MKLVQFLSIFLFCSLPLFAEENFVVTYTFNNSMSPEAGNYSAFTAKNAVADGTAMSSPGYVTEASGTAWRAGINNNNPNFVQTFVRFDIEPKIMHRLTIDSVVSRQKHSATGGAYNFVVGCALNEAKPAETSDRVSFTANYSDYTYYPPAEYATSQNGESVSVWFSARGLVASTSLWYIDEVQIYGRYSTTDEKPTVAISTNKKQKIRLGIDAERLWYWRSGIKNQLAEAAVGELQADYVRVAINCAYELTEGVKNESAYKDILEMMTAMRQANPSINFFASPRPLMEAYSADEKVAIWGHVDNTPWSPYPPWILQWDQDGTKVIDGVTVPNWVKGYFDYPALTQYYADYLNFMHNKGFNIRYLDMSNEQTVITPAITKYIYEHLPAKLNPGVELPSFIAPSTWSVQGGIDWLDAVDQSKDEHLAFEIAAVHNTGTEGSLESFATKAHALNKEAWNTELHEWVGMELHDDIMNSAIFWEHMRAGFTGIDTWLFYGPGAGKPHSMIWAYPNRMEKTGKYEIFKQVVNNANGGNYVEISQPSAAILTSAFIKDNTLSVWILNKTDYPISDMTFNLAGWYAQQNIEVTKWHNSLPMAGQRTTFTAGSSDEFTYHIAGQSLYFFKITVDGNTSVKQTAHEKEFTVYSEKKEIFIKRDSSLDGASQYIIYNLQGQILENANLIGHITASKTKSFQPGTYIVSIIQNGKSTNHKVLVK